jgi:hypothetical protein
MSYYTDQEAILEKQRIRAESEQVSCPYCHEPAGFPCRNRSNGEQLEHIPAHISRIKEAQN